MTFRTAFPPTPSCRRLCLVAIDEVPSRTLSLTALLRVVKQAEALQRLGEEIPQKRAQLCVVRQLIRRRTQDFDAVLRGNRRDPGDVGWLLRRQTPSWSGRAVFLDESVDSCWEA